MDLRNALQELGGQIKQEILRRMESPIGINPRTGTNTLVDSDLYKSVEVTAIDDTTLVFSILQHWEYVALGWRSTGRFPGTRAQFLLNLIRWIQRKGIKGVNKRASWIPMSENTLAWYIMRNIFRHGIKARPFINYDPEERPDIILPFLNDFFDKWADNVYNEICKELDNYFNS